MSQNFEINKYDYDEEYTSSIMNLYSGNERYLEYSNNIICLEFRLLDAKLNQPSKSIFKKTFGKQLKCVNYTNRNWIWTFNDTIEYPVRVNCLVNVNGIYWEYDKRGCIDLSRIYNLQETLYEALILNSEVKVKPLIEYLREYNLTSPKEEMGERFEALRKFENS